MPIFPTNKGHGNWFQKSEAKTIEDGIESHLFFPWYFYILYNNQKGHRQQRYTCSTLKY